MKEEWLMPDAVVPVDADTTAALVAEIKRLIGVVGDLALRQALEQPDEVLAEREACAKLCDDLAETHEQMNQWGSYKTAESLAQAIRARSEK